MIEKTFEELISEQSYDVDNFNTAINVEDALNLLKQVREATITEALEYCVSNEWIETIDNLKKMPTDKIIIYETPK